MTYKQTTSMTSTTSASPSHHHQALGLHRNSHNITKVQPKIRIIHIYAPEVIKTDVANFRELVQRLTGKPSAETIAEGKGRGKGKGKSNKVNVRPSYEDSEEGRIGCDKSTVNTKLEVMMGSGGSSSSPSSSSDQHHQQHDHQDFWRSTAGDHANTSAASGGFLSAFNELDDSFDLSMLTTIGGAATVDGSSHHHLNYYGENAQLSFRG